MQPRESTRESTRSVNPAIIANPAAKKSDPERLASAIREIARAIREKEIDANLSLQDQIRGACVEISQWCFEDTLGKAIRTAFMSFTERGPDNEPMGVADAGFAIANAIRELARAVEGKR